MRPGREFALRIAATAMVASALALPASAQRTTPQTVPTLAISGTGIGSNPAGFWTSMGQTFLTPGSYQEVTDFSFWFLSFGTPTRSTRDIFAYLVELLPNGRINLISAGGRLGPPPCCVGGWVR